MGMSNQQNLVRSINRTVSSLAVIQILITLVVTIVLSIPIYAMFLVVTVTIPFHLLLYYLLVKRKHQFIFTVDNRPLERLNISNILSLFRMSSAPTVLYLIIVTKSTGKFVFIIPYVAVVFLTDLLDGYLARRLNQATLIGKYLDSSTDYFLLFCIALIFRVFGLLPLWFFILIIIRLLLMTIGVTYIYVKQGFIDPQSSYLGKASIFAIMIVAASMVLALVLEVTSFTPSWRDTLLSVIDRLIYMAAGIVIASCFEKIKLLLQTIREIKSDKK